MDENPFQNRELVKVELVRIDKVEELVDGKHCTVSQRTLNHTRGFLLVQLNLGFFAFH